jgi:PAS domain S-box-containing protein
MLDFLAPLFDTSGFVPRRSCGAWTPQLVWLHNVSDALIWLAYLAISLVLVHLVYRRRDVPFHGMFWMFGAFIAFCGFTHLLEVVVFYVPVYRLIGAVKLVTAIASWATAFALIPTIPKALSLRGPEELEREIAERRRAEERLQAQVEQTRYQLQLTNMIADRAAEALFLTDSEGRVTFMNPAAEQMFGWDQGELIGQSLHARIHYRRPDGTPYPADECPQAKVLSKGVTIHHHEDVYFRRDGAPVPVCCSNAPVVTEGRITGAVLVVSDNTQRKRLEDELKRRVSELATVDSRKDEFLAMLGHELRNPLAPIRNAVKLMRLRGSDDPELHWARDVIDHQVQQMARLVDDLLDVSRITRGKVTLHKETVDVASLAADAVEISRPLIDARKQDLSVDLPPEPVLLDADPVRLAQVLANLLTNAAKYTGEGGQIRLSVVREGEEAVFRVRDTGIGIPEEMLSCIFDLFIQLDHSLDRSQGGLGIGLTLVRRLVEMHGGRVEALSDGPGRGSEFVVRLPALSATRRPSIPTPDGTQSDRACPARRVLIIDDNVHSAESLALVLRYSGHAVQTAFDGSSALEAARACPPEVVLLDIGLPDMDGYEIARRLLGAVDQRIELLVAMTGYAEDEARRRSEQAGFDLHLVKPIDPDEVLALLASLEWHAPPHDPGALRSVAAAACPAGSGYVPGSSVRVS